MKIQFIHEYIVAYFKIKRFYKRREKFTTCSASNSMSIFIYSFLQFIIVAINLIFYSKYIKWEKIKKIVFLMKFVSNKQFLFCCDFWTFKMNYLQRLCQIYYPKRSIDELMWAILSFFKFHLFIDGKVFTRVTDLSWIRQLN